MAKTVMIQGTGSGVGKSLVVAGLCRIFSDLGLSVAPFKSQNMALNSYITAQGGEIGRAQALQAEAARTEPSTDMNPVLLKVSGNHESQVIVQGKVRATMKAAEYYAYKTQIWGAVTDSFDRLAAAQDLIVIEGAGSPAEVNLKSVEIVNMSVARYAKAPVLLIGDIEKGGVFAALYGTVKLLGRESGYIKGFLINKFRGDLSLLEPGFKIIRKRTGRPVVGVLPYVANLGLPEEDGQALLCQSPWDAEKNPGGNRVKIVVVRLPYIANFTDFDPFLYEPDVDLIYSMHPREIEHADLVIVPGSKNSAQDLRFLKQGNLDASIKRAYTKGVGVIGVCGGYQMLGKKLFDPDGVESAIKESDGIGLLDIETTMRGLKTTCRVEASINRQGFHPQSEDRLKGFEIHMGESTGQSGLFKLKRLPGQGQPVADGSFQGNCWGSYIHGIFENDAFRRSVINSVRAAKGLEPFNPGVCYGEQKEKAIDNFAAIVRENLDWEFVKRLVGL